jgi:DtxR family Mn-dependent transcriptional regulator
MLTLKNFVPGEDNDTPGLKTSETIEEYCEAIYNLAADEPGPVRAVQLADRMGVAPPTVFATLQRMQKSGLLLTDQLRLTEAGEQIALKLARRHNLLECFLLNHLGLAWHEVHQEACRLEHVLSPAVEEALNRFLGYPATCPHGNLIPGSGFELPGETQPLDRIPAGGQVEIVRISEEGEHQAGLLEYVYRHGLLPGTFLRVKDNGPYGEVIQIENSQGQEFGLERKTAHAIRVTHQARQPETTN